MKCEACTRGDHWNCGMQSWCECDDESDGYQDVISDFSFPEVYADEEVMPFDPFYS